jgi:hypothetical protein
LYQLPKELTPNDGPCYQWGFSKTFIQRRLHHDIRVANITGIDLTAWNLAATWDDCEYENFETVTGGSVEYIGKLSPNISPLTDLEFEFNPVVLDNSIVDMAKIQANIENGKMILNVIFGIADLIIGAVGKIVPGFDTIGSIVGSTIGAIPDITTGNVDDLANLVDTDKINDIASTANARWKFSQVNFPSVQIEEDDDHYGIVLGFTRPPEQSNLPDDFCTQVDRRLVDGNANLISVPTGEAFLPEKIVALDSSATERTDWFLLDALKSTKMTMRAMVETEVGFSNFSTNLAPISKISAGLNGGNLEYDFHLVVPFPAAWVTTPEGKPEQVSGWNAILIDDRVFAWFDGANWHSKSALFITATV